MSVTRTGEAVISVSEVKLKHLVISFFIFDPRRAVSTEVLGVEGLFFLFLLLSVAFDLDFATVANDCLILLSRVVDARMGYLLL